MITLWILSALIDLNRSHHLDMSQYGHPSSTTHPEADNYDSARLVWEKHYSATMNKCGVTPSV